MHKSERNVVFEILTIALLAIAFFVSSVLFIFIRNNFFPIINCVILFSTLFLFGGRYRLYAFLFASSFSSFMTIIDSKIGSFLTWNMCILLVVVIIEKLVKKEVFTTKDKNLFLIFVLFVIYMFVVDLINIKNVSLLKFMSIISYLSIPLIMTLDKKAYKKTSILILIYFASIFGSNLYTIVFVYFFKSATLSFFAAYLPGHESWISPQELTNYRFSGLTGDPNHNGFYILLISAISVVYVFKNKEKRPLIILLSILVQVFALLGQSKTYFLLLGLFLFVLILALAKKINHFALTLCFFLTTLPLLLLIIISIPSLSNSISRLLNTDLRMGFLESFTSQRVHIWENYLSHFNTNPLISVLGHGVWTAKLFSYDYHNVYIQVLWEFGFIGTFLFSLYMKDFLLPKSKEENMIKFLPLLVVVLFGLSLHVAYDEFIYGMLFIYGTIVSETSEGGNHVGNPHREVSYKYITI